MNWQRGFFSLVVLSSLSFFSPSLFAQNCSNNQTPVANAGPDRSGNVGVAMNFTGSGTDSDGTIAAYWFNFGDGSFASWQSSPLASHSFASAGTFSVRLWVKDNCGAMSASDTAVVTITQAPANPCAGNTAPIANAGPDRAGNPNVALLLTGYASTDLQSNISHYWWNFGDGQYTGWQTSAGVSHAFANTGTYSVRLWVKDSCGAMSAADTVIVSIVNPNPCAGNTPPNAIITSPSSGLVNQSLNFSGLSSSDSTGTIQSYSWNFGDGQSANGVNVSHSYASPGNKTVTLTLADSCGAQGSMTRTIVISNPDPCAGNQPPIAQASANPANANINQSISFSAVGSSDPNGSITSYSWNFGDGSNGSGINASHAYASAGSFNVILTVTDNCGATATKTISVNITNPNQGLSANFEVEKLIHVDPQTGEETWEAMEPNEQGQIEIELGLRFRLNASASTGAISYVWRRNNFVIGTTPVLMQQYSQVNQIYTIKLTAYGSGGQSANLTKTIHVAAGITVAEILNPDPQMVFWNHGTVKARGLIWVVDNVNKLRGVRPDNGQGQMELVFDILVGGANNNPPRYLVGSEEYIAVSRGDGVYVYPLLDPPPSAPAGSVQLGESVHIPLNGVGNMAIVGDYLYMPAIGVLRIYDLSDPENPEYVRSVSIPGMDGSSVLLPVGNWVFAGVMQPHQVKVLDAHDPANPTQLPFALPLLQPAIDMDIHDSLLVIVENDSGYSLVSAGALSLFDVSNLSEVPQFLGRFSEGATYRRVRLSSGLAHVSTVDNVRRIDITDPTAPYLRNINQISYSPGSMVWDGGSVFVGCTQATLVKLTPID